MSTPTNIQWTDVVDNIIVVKSGGWWCCKISEGCGNCYAAKLNQNTFYGGNQMPYSGKPPELKLRTDIIDGWARQTKPKKHFVASMTDVFGDWVDWAWQLNFLRGMWRAPKQTFQVLTKRPDVAAKAVIKWLDYDGLGRVPDNIWIGTSVENQARADERIPHLLTIPAKVRFLSCEPLLGPIELNLKAINYDRNCNGPTADKPSIDWVIAGGESGKNARPCDVDWIRSLVQQCKAAGVPAFVKQLGARAYQSPEKDGGTGYELGLNHSKGGDPAEWTEDLRVQQFPNL